MSNDKGSQEAKGESKDDRNAKKRSQERPNCKKRTASSSLQCGPQTRRRHSGSSSKEGLKSRGESFLGESRKDPEETTRKRQISIHLKD
ncbi:hypothetical protein TNCT_79921 [Trichonephila clavata]|uniref:Uncharacterized protein n=1 Tax=Trichonephila clavata TaxID=2740835 RepID=A0A8X6H830_TRICU|nr:hypothetical protein TNCT_79921 [Trichonephila clavata]